MIPPFPAICRVSYVGREEKILFHWMLMFIILITYGVLMGQNGQMMRLNYGLNLKPNFMW
jgi:hypothetical protein